jgi:hypothetical protein
MKNHTNAIENNEIIDILKQSSYGWFINELLDEDNYMKKSGRLNRSKIGRKLGYKYSDIKLLLDICKKIIEE